MITNGSFTVESLRVLIRIILEKARETVGVVVGVEEVVAAREEAAMVAGEMAAVRGNNGEFLEC